MKQKLEAHKITRPIQLLAAWLVGLVLVNGSFLAAATAVSQPSWVPGVLVIASIVNVPLFLIAIFFLQTRYRPEMQEDTFYAKYLETKTKERYVLSSTSMFAELADIRKELMESSSRLLEFMDKTNDTLSKFSSQVKDIMKSTESPTEIKSKLQELEKKISESKSEIRMAKERVEWYGIRVQINNKLKVFAELSSRLGDANIPISNVFGVNTPRYFQLSIGNGVQIDHLRELVNIAYPLGLDYVEYTDGSMHSGCVYIGSYGHEHESFGAKVTPELIQILNSPETIIEEMQQMIRGRGI